MLAIDRNGTPASACSATSCSGTGLLIATGVPGVYGRSGEFEDTVRRGRPARRARSGRGDDAEVMRFPPVLNRAHFERSGYLKSFPHLAGTIHSFAGSERAHRELLEAVAQGGDWSAAFPPPPSC